MHCENLKLRIFSLYSNSEIIKAINFARIWWKIVHISRNFSFMLPCIIIDFFLITNQTH